MSNSFSSPDCSEVLGSPHLAGLAVSVNAPGSVSVVGPHTTAAAGSPGWAVCAVMDQCVIHGVAGRQEDAWHRAGQVMVAPEGS